VKYVFAYLNKANTERWLKMMAKNTKAHI